MCAGAGACVVWASGCGMGWGEVGVEGGADREEVVGGQVVCGRSGGCWCQGRVGEEVGVDVPRRSLVNGFPVLGCLVVVAFEPLGVVFPSIDGVIELSELMRFVVVPGSVGFVYPVVPLHVLVLERCALVLTFVPVFSVSVRFVLVVVYELSLLVYLTSLVFEPFGFVSLVFVCRTPGFPLVWSVSVVGVVVVFRVVILAVGVRFWRGWVWVVVGLRVVRVRFALFVAVVAVVTVVVVLVLLAAVVQVLV